uniref:Allophycocyanin beta 18 subunit n=1 Tax=Glaucocystis incrassata TaxID=1789788 RepID=A0A3G1IV92_9EUKA|nr:allophycocyanin beta 18 subunit [Glaucocystis incrassata]ASQ39976.1 allophycocyanin beta 18 subunit [Glaucocystis incrassata]
MRDLITDIINRYDLTGKYLDKDAIDSLKTYFATGPARIQATKLIGGNISNIVKEAAGVLFTELPELIRPGGNANTTRRYAACLRDLDYYLRYATYAIIAGDVTILEERVLNGLKDTYNSLGVPIGPTVRGIELLKEKVKELFASNNIAYKEFLNEPFDYLVRGLSETNI